jgi:hypothetical protein
MSLSRRVFIGSSAAAFAAELFAAPEGSKTPTAALEKLGAWLSPKRRSAKPHTATFGSTGTAIRISSCS